MISDTNFPRFVFLLLLLGSCTHYFVLLFYIRAISAPTLLLLLLLGCNFLGSGPEMCYLLPVNLAAIRISRAQLPVLIREYYEMNEKEISQNQTEKKMPTINTAVLETGFTSLKENNGVHILNS